MVSKTWVGMSATNIHLPQFKYQSYLHRWGFWMSVYHNSYRRKTVLTLHSPFCLLMRKKKYSNWMAILSTLESTSLDDTIRCALKWFILSQREQNIELGQSQLFYSHTIHSSSLKDQRIPQGLFKLLPVAERVCCTDINLTSLWERTWCHTMPLNVR